MTQRGDFERPDTGTADSTGRAGNRERAAEDVRHVVQCCDRYDDAVRAYGDARAERVAQRMRELAEEMRSDANAYAKNATLLQGMGRAVSSASALANGGAADRITAALAEVAPPTAGQEGRDA